VARLGLALLSLKEVEYFGAPQSGTVAQRLSALIDHLLAPLEKEWLPGRASGGQNVVARVKRLRAAILPDMVAREVDEAERQRRWRQLADCYLAQQLSFYPPDYLRDQPSAERLLETVERYEEDLTDDCRAYPPMVAVARVGPAIAVSPERQRGGDDPLLASIDEQLRGMIASIDRPERC
jgi:hypothetical protein